MGLQRYEELQADLEQLAEPWNAIAVSGIIGGAPFEYLHNHQRAFPLASILKLPIAMLVTELAATGEVSWEQALNPRREDTQEINLPDCLPTDAVYTTHTCLALSLTLSDNRSANALLNLIGPARFGDWVQSRFDVTMGQFRDYSDQNLPHNVSEARAPCTAVLAILDELLASPSYSLIRRCMENCFGRSRVAAGLEATTPYANKTGTLTPLGVFSDAGYGYFHGQDAPFRVVFLTEGAPNRAHAEKAAAALGSVLQRAHPG